MVTVIVVCDGYCCAIGVQHTSAKSGGELVTLFGGYSYDGLNAAIGVQHRGGKSGGELVTLFGSYSDDGLNESLRLHQANYC